MEPTPTSETPVGRRGPQNNAEFWHRKKKMALRNGSTPPPDPRVHPGHRLRSQAGMVVAPSSTGTNRFRPSVTPSRPPEVTIEYLKELRGLILDAHLRMLGTGTGRATNSAHRGVPQDRSHPPQPISTRSMGRVGSNDWKAEWD